MTAGQQNNWTDANQRFLVAEFTQLKALLGGGETAGAGEAPGSTTPGEAKAASATQGEAYREHSKPVAIDTLTRLFGLSEFERQVLLLTAGVEMDAALAAQCGEAQGRPQHPWGTFGLALAVLPEPHWSALTPAGSLRRWRLIEVDDSGGLVSARLRIDERILHYLAGINCLDSRLQPLSRAAKPPELMATGQQEIAEEIERSLRQQRGTLSLILLNGDDGHGQEDIAAQVVGNLGMGLHVIAAGDLPSSALDVHTLSTLWQREAVMSATALLIEGAENASGDILQRFLARNGTLTFVAGREPISIPKAALTFSVNKPGTREQRDLWKSALGEAAASLDGDLDEVASHYHLSARSIQWASARAASLLSDSEPSRPVLLRSCREVESATMGALAQRIRPMAGWDDLILPATQKGVLRQIVTHVRHRLTVYLDWGFASKGLLGLGISALFTGESGTGKTMAAEVVAGELGLDLYRIDLSAVVNKYIGETEKNLRRVFDAGEGSGAILLFDEADALFGKRSEVKDSHDRYANIEVSYLLQRMEAYCGLAILTTNIKQALDSAFHRRLRFVVSFPFPDSAQREAIWRGIFPPELPLHGIDYSKLARLNAAGGNIRNIALNAAFSAAQKGESVCMAHLLKAAHLEAGKIERPVSDAETRGWT